MFLYGWKVEIVNIRAEQREGRDLLQADLAAYEASLAQVPSILFSNIPEEAIGTISLLIYLGTLAIALLACGTAVYLLCPGRRNQINNLWAKM